MDKLFTEIEKLANGVKKSNIEINFQLRVGPTGFSTTNVVKVQLS